MPLGRRLTPGLTVDRVRSPPSTRRQGPWLLVLACALTACTEGHDARQSASVVEVRSLARLTPRPQQPKLAPRPTPPGELPGLIIIASAEPPTPPHAGDLDDSGVVVTVAKERPGTGSRSIGHPRKGRLVGGVQLQTSRGIRVGWPRRSWATEDTIFDLLDAIDEVRRRHPQAHDLLIGDLSLPRGGPMKPHHSHQSGRDVDLGLYFTDAPQSGLDGFRGFDAPGFDTATTWSLIQALVGPDPAHPRVKDIFLAWEAQEVLRSFARRQGVSDRDLDLIFQVPRGGGIVRHVEGHRNHIHVRFPCPKGRVSCTDVAPESVAFQKVRRKCVKRRRRSARRGSELQRLLAGKGPRDGVLARIDGGRDTESDPDVHCFIVELE